jgi:endoglucanase
LDSVWKYVYLLFYGSLQIKNKVNKRQKQARLPVHAKLLNLETKAAKMCIRAMRAVILLCLNNLLLMIAHAQPADAWIRINQLGYSPKGVKVVVFVSKVTKDIATFELVDAKTSRSVLKKEAGKNYGAYGPFMSSYRLDFSEYQSEGTYYIKTGEIRSKDFNISQRIYEGHTDFLLRYMRQQRSGYNPFLKDSCHTKDGYTIYGPMPDGTYVDVSGGWHDATDYLQYSATSANATYHLLAAYRDFPSVFSDKHQANGLPGSNKVPDVLDEGVWGLQWLLKMHPRDDWMFNQLADDRDHIGFRLPTNDPADYGYGKGNGRPVYFISGEVQGLGKYKNRATGAASTAGKFASAFALGSQIQKKENPKLAETLRSKSISAYQFGLAKPGVAQTAPMKGPYFYEEDNWVDDMELGAAAIYQLTQDNKYLKHALEFATQERVTPWIAADTAAHYQWYPFHNFGHYELALSSNKDERNRLISFYREGIEKIWTKAKHNVFYRGVPFIWCSNNLTTSFAIQCYLYRKLSGDDSYKQLEQACFDWLFGCNPWGTSMVFGLPADGDTPVDPHSSLTVLYNYALDGGLVDGPVSGHLYKKLLGLTLTEPDEYAEFQSLLAVYHDDHGDYSTNEPTMDGTASLVYLMAAKESDSREVGSAKK